MPLPGLIDSLLDPEAYPGRPAKVELRQTHISYIFLTPDFAYKIKKPVDFGFLDFTTLEKRRFYCEEEVRLNRRLSEGVYLGVVKVTLDRGKGRFEGEGEPVEYAVKMKRIPDESILSFMIERDTATTGVIVRVAHRIASFHKGALTDGRISAFGSPDIVRRNAEENFTQTEDQVGKTISGELYGRIRSYTEGFLEANSKLFLKRMGEGFIRDCHGDLHSDHVSITDGINIFDCIEFNERFRFSDVVADAAFLSMDLDFMNRIDLSRAFEEAYFRETGDLEGTGLLGFYKCYRAYVRGKVAGFKAVEKEVGAAERRDALLDARRHYFLAGLYAAGGARPLLVMVRGLSLTGKSTLARGLSELTGMVRISSDAVRKELAGLPREARVRGGYREGIYSEEFTLRTYREMTARAIALLKSGRSVVIDATFLKRPFFKDAKKAAEDAGAVVRVIECTSPEGVVRERCLRRLKEGAEPGETVSDAGWEIYIRQKAGYEEVEGPVLKVDTSLRPDEVMGRVTGYIWG